MKNINKNQQSGRSMLEILLVLMIMGLFTAMGILVFPTLLEKYRSQKLLEDFLTLANEIRVKHSNTGDYTGISNEILVEYELVDKKYATGGGTNTVITFAYKNDVSVKTDSTVRPINSAFQLTLKNLNKAECFYIGSQDYNSTLSEVQRVGIGVGNNLTYFTKDKPTVEKVHSLCDCIDTNSDNNCTISLSFL